MDLAAAAGDRDRAGLHRAVHSPAGFATALTFTYLAFFEFNKQAFCNYYYLVIATACWSIAATRIPRHRPAADAIRGLASPV